MRDRERENDRDIQYLELPLGGISARHNQLIHCNKEHCNLLLITFAVRFNLDRFRLYVHVLG